MLVFLGSMVYITMRTDRQTQYIQVVMRTIYLQDLLSLEGFPSHHVTVVEKQLFKSTVLK